MRLHAPAAFQRFSGAHQPAKQLVATLPCPLLQDAHDSAFAVLRAGAAARPAYLLGALCEYLGSLSTAGLPPAPCLATLLVDLLLDQVGGGAGAAAAQEAAVGSSSAPSCGCCCRGAEPTALLASLALAPLHPRRAGRTWWPRRCWRCLAWTRACLPSMWRRRARPAACRAARSSQTSCCSAWGRTRRGAACCCGRAARGRRWRWPGSSGWRARWRLRRWWRRPLHQETPCCLPPPTASSLQRRRQVAGGWARRRPAWPALCKRTASTCIPHSSQCCRLPRTEHTTLHIPCPLSEHPLTPLLTPLIPPCSTLFACFSLLACSHLRLLCEIQPARIAGRAGRVHAGGAQAAE